MTKRHWLTFWQLTISPSSFISLIDEFTPVADDTLPNVFRETASFTFLVRWHDSAVSLPLVIFVYVMNESPISVQTIAAVRCLSWLYSHKNN
jgi:hypothetical protein